MDGDLLDIDLVASSNGNCGVGALREDHSPGPLCVLLGAVGNDLGNLLDVLGVEVVRFSESSSLGLVTNEDVDIGENLIERVLEKLCDKGSGQVEDERLVCISFTYDDRVLFRSSPCS